jgi:hypothetical protein
MRLRIVLLGIGAVALLFAGPVDAKRKGKRAKVTKNPSKRGGVRVSKGRKKGVQVDRGGVQVRTGKGRGHGVRRDGTVASRSKNGTFRAKTAHGPNYKGHKDSSGKARVHSGNYKGHKAHRVGDSNLVVGKSKNGKIGVTTAKDMGKRNKNIKAKHKATK